MVSIYQNLKSVNRLLANCGLFFLLLTSVLFIYAFINTTQVLGVNAIIKPIKFSSSLCIFSFTMAYLLQFWDNQKSVKKFAILAISVMFLEQFAITFQALRGHLSHFNITDLFGGMLYSCMGIAIVTLTLATLWMAIIFMHQQTYAIHPIFVLSIKIGLLFFVLFSFMGGYMSAINSHNVGGPIGQAGLPILNWSTLFGDVRVAHFFGLHTLQLMPLFGFYISKKSIKEQTAIILVWLFSFLYFSFVAITFVQALLGKPFVAI